jgi:RES domain-containing protein
MRAFRLVKARHAEAALDGEGARRVGGRWNAPGLAMTYCSSSLSLAVLELLVHVEVQNLPEDLIAIELEIPDGLAHARWPPEALPGNWRQESGRGALRALGTQWLKDRRSGVLWVPSVIVPAELNILLNPDHPDVARVKVLGREPFSLDPRLAAAPRPG